MDDMPGGASFMNGNYTYIHTNVHTYIHTYIHAYVHTYDACLKSIRPLAGKNILVT
jgi:hypothetical protein